VTFPPQRRVMPKERALSKEGVRTNNRAIPWQPSYAYNDPLLFVIPSEAEESAVRHSGAPDLPVYDYLPFVILRACDFFNFPYSLWPESSQGYLPTSIAGVLRLRAINPRVCDRSAWRFAPSKNISSKGPWNRRSLRFASLRSG
jgi:hypothetical protein